MKHIEAVIFDWAGTTVDYGCMAPMHAMQAAFSEENIAVSLAEIRQPMGLLKRDHIKAVLNMENVQAHFTQHYGRKPDLADIEKIYTHFEKNIMASLHQYTKLIDGVLNVQYALRNQNIKIGSTTGYTQEMIHVVAKSAKQQGYAPDFMISADQVKHGRPYPYMLYHNVMALEVQNMRGVIKVGDTVVDILEGLNAGCWSVGVVKGSSMMGMSEAEAEALPPQTLSQKMEEIKSAMLAAGADYVIDSIEELQDVIAEIQQKISERKIIQC